MFLLSVATEQLSFMPSHCGGFFVLDLKDRFNGHLICYL